MEAWLDFARGPAFVFAFSFMVLGLIRHLVLPGGLAGTREVMKFIAKKISKNSYINIMSQYRPCGHAGEIEELAAPLSASDFKAAVKIAQDEGLRRLDRPGRFLFNQ